MKLTFFETSAKDNKNVNEAFFAITRLALHQRLEARTRAQGTQSNNLRNEDKNAQRVKLKSSKRPKKKDKYINGTCCN